MRRCDRWPARAAAAALDAHQPLPRLPQYLAESRGLGVSICYAAQAGSELDAIYLPLLEGSSAIAVSFTKRQMRQRPHL